MTTLNLDKLQTWITSGRLDPTHPITIRELAASRCVSSIKDGVKLLAKNSDAFTARIHVTVSRASGAAIEAIEKAGGSVQTRYYTNESIRRVVRGETHPTLSMLSVPSGPVPAAEMLESPASPGIPDTSSSSVVSTAPSSTLALLQKYKYRLPDPTSRKDLEYYRDAAHRGYLSHQVQEGQGPSLFFKTPVEVAASMARRKTGGAAGTGGKGKAKGDNRIW